MDVSQKTKVVHYSDDIKLIKPDEQDMASISEALIRYMCSRSERTL